MTLSPEISKQFPSFAKPGDRVHFELHQHENPAERLGYGTVEYEWLCLDVIAVKVRLDDGRVINALPDFGDEIKVIA